MKNSKLIILLIFPILSMTGCKESSVVPKSELSANVNGKTFIGEHTYGQSVPMGVDIISTRSDGQSISLFLPYDIEVGTYTFDGMDYIGTYVESSTFPNTLMYFSHKGTLTIDRHDMKNGIIKGSFFFEGTSDPKGHPNAVVSEGKFYSKY